MIQSLFIITGKGEILIERHWCGRISRSVGEKFWSEVEKCEKPEDASPVMQSGNYYLFHVYRYGIYFVGVTRKEIPPLMGIELLNRIVEIIKTYCKKISEDTIQQNFVTIYQLLDEIIDFGFPLTTEQTMLSDLVKPPPGESLHVSKPTFGHSNGPNIEWRKTGIKYNQNQFYLDIVEEINSTIDVNGIAVNCEINGVMNVNCRLSGMPDLLLYLKDPSLVSDSSFHPCVRYSKYEQDKVISFVPPDGNFELMKYRVKDITIPQIYCRPQINWFDGGANVQIMANSKSIEGNSLEEVRIIVPLPKSVVSSKVTTTFGNVKFDSKKKELIWTIGKFNSQNQKTPSCSGQIFLENNTKVPDTTPSVELKFKIPSIAYSGLKIDQVVVKGETYKAFKGVRYVTISGKYQIRTC